MYSCFVHLLYLDRLSWANVIKWKGSLRSPSLFTPDLIVAVLSIYIRRELIDYIYLFCFSENCATSSCCRKNGLG